MIIPFNKPVGKTSFWAVEHFKKIYPKQKIGYVGTLDPMAEGLLLMLVGSDTKRCLELTNLPKEYEFEVVLGIGTDTGDVLGFPEKAWKIREIRPCLPNAKPLGDAGLEIGEIDEKAKSVVAGFMGEYLQTVPGFSAIKSGGKKLHEISRKKALLESDLPKRLVKINKITLLNLSAISLQDLKEEIFKRLDLLVNYGNQFRKPDVVKQWNEFFKEYEKSGTPVLLTVAKIRVEVSKGTYIRSLATDVGKKIGIPYSFCLSIKRTKVGDYILEKN
jgi:tRNA U55 pseudouridine synthase TruB